MLRRLILLLSQLAGPASAETTILSIAQDRYEAGSSLRFDGPTVSDLFMAGNRVVVAAPVAGSAHLAGRRWPVICSPSATALWSAARWAAMPRWRLLK